MWEHIIKNMKKVKEKLYEVDLYEPIQKYFTKKGFEVYGEVKHCDLVAMKEDKLIIVEFKLNLNIELLIQATKRQRLSEAVYIAIPKPKYNMFSKKWKDICFLIRRLELGLIVVSFQNGVAQIDIKFEPSPFDKKKSMKLSRKKRESIIKEVNGRHGDYNVGGSVQTKIMTAYRENCIQIAVFLERTGPKSSKKLQEMGTGERTYSILTKNYYGWFEKIKRGTYAISELGKEELKDYPEQVSYFDEKLISENN